MKKRNKQIAKFLKLGVFLFGTSLLLWNCEKDIETIEPKQETLEAIETPVIQTLSLNELREDSKFNELKKSYEILQNTTQAKRTEDNLILTDLLEGLDISIEVSTIKKITSNNYVSYTMLMVEPNDDSNNFSNLVIQEKEGVQRIFTVRYFTSKKEAKSSQVSKSSTEQYTIEMRSGINSYTEPWGDPDGGGSGGSGTSGCEEYETVCNTVNIWSSVCSCRGHFPEEYCTCTGERTDFMQTVEECEDVCIWDDTTGQTGGTTGSGTTGGAGSSSGTGTTTEPTDVVTSPVNPDGSTSYEYINNNLSLKSPFKVDMTQVLDSIILPTINPENKIAAEKFKCIYDKVTKSPKFKDLFIDLFGTNKDINVTFEIANDFVTKPDGTQTNGNCKLENYSLNTDGSIKTANAKIKINKNKLTATSFQLSNILMAKTIVHESIHAFLSVKRKDCNAGITIDYLNNLEFKELIEEYYDGTCATKQEQHEFMFDYMVPTLSKIFTEVRDDLIPQSNIDYVSDYNFYNISQTLNGPLSSDHPWSWIEFFNNISLMGLHDTESFFKEVKNNDVKYFIYQQYNSISRNFTKNCNN